VKGFSSTPGASEEFSGEEITALSDFEEHGPLEDFSRIFDEESKRLDPSGEGVPSEVVRDAVRERLYREYGNRLGPGWQSKSDGG
jgi:hypothetical protein